MPNSARAFSRAVASNSTLVRSTPLGMTATFRGRRPHLTSRSRTAGDTATVISDMASVARYRARTLAVIFRRSRCVSPIECSVLRMTGTPASQAAGRP